MTILPRCLLSLALVTAACSGSGADEDSARGHVSGQDQGDPSQSSDPSASAPSPGASSMAGDYAKVKYPIVLAHGLLGFRRLGGVVDYFFGIPGDLRSSGAQVFVTQVSAVNSSEARGEQLLAQIERITAETGAGKVNLVAHSQGGIDSRYVMNVRPDLIASLTTVASPHLGGGPADDLLTYVNDNAFNELVVIVFGNAFGAIEDLLTGTTEPQDVIGALRTLSAAGAAAFNKKYPAGLPTTKCGTGAAMNGDIPLFSWAGSTIKTNSHDLSDTLLGLTGAGFTEENDGLVQRCDGHFGTVLRDNYVMNHLDEINQMFSLTAASETDPREVYRVQANRLKLAGL